MHQPLSARTPALAACLAVAAMAPSVRAQGDATSDAAGFSPQPARLSLRVEAMAWYMGPGGLLDMPSTDALGNPGSFDIDALGYDSPRFVAAPEVSVEWGEQWRVTLRGYQFSNDHTAVVGNGGQIGTVFFDAGSELESTFSFGCYEAEVGYRIFDFPESLKGVKDRDFFGSVEIVGGLRYFDMGWSVGRSEAGSFPGTQRASVDETFIAPLIGTRMRLDFAQTLGLDVAADFSGMPTDEGVNLSGGVMVGGWWYPWTNVGVQIGYRAASFRLGSGSDEEEFVFAGWNQGLQFGVVVSF